MWLIATGLILGLVGLAILRGFVLSVLWGWFLVPLGVTDIGIAGAIGISFIISMFTANNSGKVAESVTKAISTAVLTPSVILLLGWITVQFM